MIDSIPREQLLALASLDTCSVANAIECFDVRLRNEGFSDGSIRCRLPSLPAMAGYAMTLRVRSASFFAKSNGYLERNDWWTQLTSRSVPQILVVEDMDRHPGTGAFIGEVHAAILQALGCVGAITNGAVRDLPAVERLGFPLFSKTISVSHSYSHVVEIGGVVEVGGLQISPGDLLHADLHGILRVPLNIAGEIPEVVRRIREQERRVLRCCHSPDFSEDGLREVVSESPCGVDSVADRGIENTQQQN